MTRSILNGAARICLAVAAVLAPATAAAQPAAAGAGAPVDLRPRFRQGQEVRYEMDLDSTQTSGAGADESREETKQKLGLVFKVRSASAADGATVDMTYESFRYEVKGPVLNFVFDSQKPTKDDDTGMAEVLAPIVGLTLTLTIDREGNVKEVSGANSPGGALAEEIAGRFTGRDIISKVMGPIFGLHPAKAQAAVGESWTTDDTMSGAIGQLRVKHRYTLRSYKGPLAELDIEGSITLDAKSSASIRDGSTVGRATWDTEEGLLKSMDLTQKLSVEQGADAGGATVGQTMTVKVRRK